MTAADFVRGALAMTCSVRRTRRLTIVFFGIDPEAFAACDREIERWRSEQRRLS